MAEAFGDGLDRLDPVCLTEVDLPTARHTAEHAGRIIAFCAPSRRKQFLADPSIKPPAIENGRRMPNLALKQADIASLIAFINDERKLTSR